MIFKNANELIRSRAYDKAIIEFRKVGPRHPLHAQALFNIRHAEARLKAQSFQGPAAAPRAMPERAPLLSIVMPVYNVGPYLDAAIVSALSQDHDNFELIIVDDASTDNSRRIVEMYRGQDPRIRVVALDHNTLGGAGIPSNIGIREARGEYVAFIDSDDWVTKRAFSRMVALAQEHAADVVIGDFCTFTEDERVVSPAYDRSVSEGIPRDQLITLETHPALLRMSPVPWRKIYRRDFLIRHHILYPEGDYFYEDNPLHWFVLSRARRIVVCDDVVSYHRMGREGQTMGSAQFKLAAMGSHANTIWNYVKETKGEERKQLVTELYDYLYRTEWVIDKQTQPAAAAMIRRRFAAIVDRISETDPPSTLKVRQHFAARLEKNRKAYPDVDLTVVIPVYNCADLIRETIDSVMRLQGLKFNLLLIDDGSTDDSLEVVRGYEASHPNVHVFQQGNRGAGRARNALIPLITGRYTYFLDADDVIDAPALVAALRQAIRDNNDLLFFKYRIEFHDERRSRDMFNRDAETWMALTSACSNPERQRLAAGLINYPWNRIIRTQLLHDANIFFGATVVHNDIPYHWHSIASATNIGCADMKVCTHRKFTARSQITNISDARRMAVLESLRFTQQTLMDTPAYATMKTVWKKFAIDLLDWARDRIPEALRESYDEKRDRFTAGLEG